MEIKKTTALEEKLEAKTNELRWQTNYLKEQLHRESLKTQILSEKLDDFLGLGQSRQDNRTKRHLANAATNIGFSAFLTHDLWFAGADHKVQFGGVVLNDGNAYNSFTGVFTVSVDGVYFITATLGSQMAHRQWFKIVVDGSLVSTIVITPFEDWTHSMGSNVVLIRLRRGQSVWVAVDSKESGDYLQGGDGVRASTFSAFYLYP
ncbi:complement C1q-like protein 4 [Dreissena polymorpha]|uniref:complement C1q-like protein 4 n=1 Tax=Dreissena polymorpha TaxID=45954 RepID=UPI002263F531|nr:complement C1q-like protein 4 [Dreissena polymorpha]